MNNKNVVVTGGAGFIGSHLAETLARQDYEVIVLDDLSTGKLNNLEQCHHEVEFVEGSITDAVLLSKLFQGVDYVLHLAAIPSVPRSIDTPRASHDVNVTGTLNVLLAATQNKVKKVVYASSSSVYGDTPTLPKNEEMTPRPLSPYAAGKLAAESYCRVFREVYQLPTICLRYFNVYGPRQDPNSQYAAAIPKFISMAREGKPPVIFGDGEQTRDFTFVRDVVNANIMAMRSDVCGVFNVSRGESITINRLVELIMEQMGEKTSPVHQEPRKGDIKHSLADISKARAFGYEPKHDLQDGLAETLKWFNGR
ncbi:MAG: SDR family oxidoreductase [Dehalococcoidales bacterium]|nr:SDR family oxidoreductase [Dehalococcoidales bacterium]